LNEIERPGKWVELTIETPVGVGGKEAADIFRIMKEKTASAPNTTAMIG
jgi:hypothetical protein